MVTSLKFIAVLHGFSFCQKTTLTNSILSLEYLASFGTNARILLEKRLHLRRTDQPLGYQKLTWLEDYLHSSSSALVIVSTTNIWTVCVTKSMKSVSKACRYYRATTHFSPKKNCEGVILTQTKKPTRSGNKEIHDLERIRRENWCATKRAITP